MKLRQRLSALWRWPLRSRGRAISTATTVLLLVVLWPKISGSSADAQTASTDSPAAQTAASAALPASEAQSVPSLSSGAVGSGADVPEQGGSSSQPVVSTTAVSTKSLVTAAPVSVAPPVSNAPTGDSQTAAASSVGPPAQNQLTAAPPPPRMASGPADYASAVTVAKQYMAVWCYQPASGAANQNLANEAAWVTAAGWADDKSRAVPTTSWTQTQKAGLTSLCGPIVVTRLTEAPNAPTLQWVQIAARQAIVNRQGQLIGQQTITQTRRILKAPDGRWLVDVQVQAG